MSIPLWHVHGSWTTAFVQEPHSCVVPVTPDRGPDGPGRARTFTWPASSREATPDRLRETLFDLVLLRRPHEIERAERLLGGRRPGRDVPAVYLEHDAPDGDVPDTRHPSADRDDPTIVHVTHFNRLVRDRGTTRTVVIGHGVVDPGRRCTGRLERAAVVVNEPLWRGRSTGTDLPPGRTQALPPDVFGIRTERLAERRGLPADRCRGADLPRSELHAAMAVRRRYLRPVRRTSLGFSPLKSMHLGVPVLAPATTEAVEAVPDGAGTVSTRPGAPARAALRRPAQHGAAAADGARARQTALEQRYGLKRFLDDWERLITTEVRS